jgi:hypothetical protein
MKFLIVDYTLGLEFARILIDIHGNAKHYSEEEAIKLVEKNSNLVKIRLK